MLDLVTDVPAVRESQSDESPNGAWTAVEAARRLASTLERYAAEADEAGSIVPESIAALHRSGLPLAVFSPAVGGRGLLSHKHSRDLVRALRHVGAGDLSIARLFEGHVNAVALVERFGTRRQAGQLAAAVRQGALSAVWNAEGRRPLVAEEDEQGLRLAGQKILASGVGIITRPIVTPRLSGEVMMVVLDDATAERTDVSSWTPTGMRASATGTIELSGVSLSREMMIGGPGDYARQPWFSGGAWRFCAVHLGAAEKLLDLFRESLRQRHRTDDPYQKQRIAAATAACLTARFWVERSADMLADGTEASEAIVSFVNLTRMVTERACLDVIETVQRGAGLGAFMRPEAIERIARDLATYLRQPVPDAAMADAAAYVLGQDTPTGDLWTA